MQCNEEGCDKILRSDNKSGYCAPHKYRPVKSVEFTCIVCGVTGYYDGRPRKICSEECKRERNRQQKQEFNERNPNYSREYYLANYKAEEGYCDVCSEWSVLQRDHDHDCCPQRPNAGHTNLCGECHRGNICRRCNVVLGLVEDESLILESMINYLQKHKEN